MSKIKIKISKVNTIEEAIFFDSMGVDYLGFCCNGTSMMYCSPAKIQEIVNHVENPQIVYEFDGWQSKVEIDFTISSGNQVDSIHLGAFATYSEPFEKPVFKDFILENIEDCDFSNVVYPVLRSEKKYTDLTETEKQQVAQLANQYPVFLDLNFSQECIAIAIEESGAAGIVLRSNATSQKLIQSLVEADIMASQEV